MNEQVYVATLDDEPVVGPVNVVQLVTGPLSVQSSEPLGVAVLAEPVTVAV